MAEERHPGRVLAAAAVERTSHLLAPLFPASRVLNAQLHELEEATTRLRDELACVQSQIECAKREWAAERTAQRAALEAECAELHRRAKAEGAVEGAARMTDMVSSLEAECAAARASWVKEIQELAFAFAGVVLRHELSTRPEALIRLIEDFLARAAHHPQVTLVVHPEALELVQGHERRLMRRMPGGNRVEFRVDPHLSRHAVRLESQRGTLAFDPHEQLERMKSLWFEAGAEPGPDMSTAVCHERPSQA